MPPAPSGATISYGPRRWPGRRGIRTGDYIGRGLVGRQGRVDAVPPGGDAAVEVVGVKTLEPERRARARAAAAKLAVDDNRAIRRQQVEVLGKRPPRHEHGALDLA